MADTPNETTSDFSSDYSATYSPEDNKLRLSSLSRLPKELYTRVRAAGFIWAPKQEIFVAPMWTPSRETLLLELCGEIGDEDTSLVDRQEQRAERFEEYSEHRADDAERAHKAVHAIADGIPLGQPILVGHHSERHARRDAEKIENGMRKAVKMWETSEYWKRRAAGAIAHAKYKELPAVRYRRIKKIEADQRKFQKNVEEAERFITSWNYPGLTHARAVKIANYDHVSKCFTLAEFPRKNEQVSKYEGSNSIWSALGGSEGEESAIITAEQAREISVRVHERTIRYCKRWLQHFANRLEYERAMLGEGGGIVADRFNIEVGGQVLTRHDEWVTVLRVTKKNGAITSVTTNARYVSKVSIENVRDYRAPSPEFAEKVKAAAKLAPMTNYPSEGGVILTAAEWARVYRDYKGSQTAAANEKHGAHRYRTMVKHGSLVPVYLSDSKRVYPPPPSLLPPAPKVELPPIEKVPYNYSHREPEEPNKFDALKDALKAGVKVVSAPQLFPTPADLAARMVELAEIEPGQDVLEPSAGTGAILQALEGTGAKVFAVEINGSLCEMLSQRFTPPEDAKQGICKNVLQGDFLECNGNLGKFDRVLMNPPFSNGADIQHITHALTFLKPGGRLVAICANGPRQNAKLRPIVEEHGGEWEELPEGTFKEQGTGVRTVLLTIPV